MLTLITPFYFDFMVIFIWLFWLVFIIITFIWICCNNFCTCSMIHFPFDLKNNTISLNQVNSNYFLRNIIQNILSISQIFLRIQDNPKLVPLLFWILLILVCGLKFCLTVFIYFLSISLRLAKWNKNLKNSLKIAYSWHCNYVNFLLFPNL